ncbi:MAG: hypothetical protein JWL71_4282, partial [Acidobacteria bacterium]|nr:hypothetical protein [Acidobacteriota bacterium]
IDRSNTAPAQSGVHQRTSTPPTKRHSLAAHISRCVGNRQFEEGLNAETKRAAAERWRSVWWRVRADPNVGSQWRVEREAPERCGKGREGPVGRNGTLRRGYRGSVVIVTTRGGRVRNARSGGGGVMTGWSGCDGPVRVARFSTPVEHDGKRRDGQSHDGDDCDSCRPKHVSIVLQCASGPSRGHLVGLASTSMCTRDDGERHGERALHGFTYCCGLASNLVLQPVAQK